MTKPTILVATWGYGLFAVTGDRRTQEIANQPVRGLAPDGRGGALAIVGRHSLRRRAPSGKWEIVATSELELSCCMSVRDTIYVGTEDARMLRLSHGGGVLDPIEGFDSVAGRDTWFAGSAIINGQRLGPPLGIRSVAANANREHPVQPTFTWEAFLVQWMAEEPGSPPSISTAMFMRCARTRQVRTLSWRRPLSAFALAATPEQGGP